MKLKFITAIVAFSITFGFSTALAGLFKEDNPTGQKISSLLERDIQNGQEMEQIAHLVASPFELAAKVGEYVDDSQAIDDADLPADFRFAWRTHMEAWRAHANFLSRSDCMRKRMSGEEISQTIDSQKSEIDATWLNVLRIGKRYGAVIPANAY